MAGLHFEITGGNEDLVRKLAESRKAILDSSKTAEQQGAKIEGMFKRMASGAAIFGAGFSASQFLKDMINVRGEYQKTQMAFETMLGSKEKADMLMSQMVQTAAKTPFDLQGVANGAKQLLAYGTTAEDVNETLIRLGNIASGLSIPLGDMVYLYGTTQTQGRLFTQDVRQFMGRGIPLVKELALMLGKTEEEINKMVTAGKIGFPEVEKVIKKMTDEGGQFYNLMEKQSETLSGQISNLGDAWDGMLNSIGEKTQGLSSATISMATDVVENYDKVGRILTALIITYGTYKAALIVTNLVLKEQAAINAMVAASNGVFSKSLAYQWVWTERAQKAQSLLNKTMLNNPFVLTGILIGALVAKMILFNDEQEKTLSKTELLKNITDSYASELAKEKSELSLLLSVAKNEKVSKENRLEAIQKLNDISPKYLGNLNLENINTKLATDAVDQYTMSLERNAKTKAIVAQMQEIEEFKLKNAQRLTELAEKEAGKNWFNEGIDWLNEAAYNMPVGAKGSSKPSVIANREEAVAIQENNKELDKKYQLLIDINSENERGSRADVTISKNIQIEAEKKNLEYLKQEHAKLVEQIKNKPIGVMVDPLEKLKLENYVSLIKESGDKINELSKETFAPSVSEEIKTVTANISTLKQQIEDLRNGKTSAEAGKTVQSAIEEKTKELKAAEDALATLTGKDKSSLKEASDRLKTKQEQSDLLLEISRNAKERENAERQTAFEIEQAKIDIMKDGFAKEQAQIDLNHRKALQGITLRGEEMLKAQQEAERKQWEKDGKKGVFTPKTTSVSQLPTEQLQLLADLMNGVVAKTDHDNQSLIDGMVKQYQTYAEKRKEIEKKFDDDIRSMQEKNTDGKYDANIKEAGKQKTEALAEIDSTVVANKSMWTRLFADTSAMSKKQIKQILSDIKNLTDYLEGLDVTIPVGFTPEQLEQLKKDPEKIKAIYDELIKKQDELDDRTNYPFSGIIKGFGKLKEAAELAEKATRATTEEEKKILEYQAESAKAKGMDYIREGAVMASDSVSMLADKLKELAAATGDERFSESAEQFGALAQNLGAAAKGFQSGGWIGAIIGGATDMLTQTFQAITTAKAEVKEFEDNRRDFLAEYNLLLLKNRISSEDQDNVFGTSALKRASEAAKAAQDAMTQYQEEITKRTVPEIKKEFNSLGAGIFGLGLDGFLGGNFLGFGKRISNETKVLQAAFEKGYTDLQAMAVKTKDRSGWANFWGKKDEYTSLKDLAPQLWDEKGEFDIEAAKVFLDTNTQISDEQRKQIQNVIDLKESYNDAMQVLKDDVADTFGSLGTGLMDSIVGAVQNGDIAMDKFAESVGKTFENLGKKIAQELFFQKEFDKLQEDLVKTYDMGNSEAIANAQMDIVSRFFDSIGGKMDEAEAWMEEWKKKAAEKGFTLWGEGESDWLGTTTDSIAQSILDGLEAGKSGIADFADDFESLMKKAVLNSIKMKYLEEPLKEFYKKFASFSESGGQLTEAEIEELRAMYGDIVSGAKAQFDNLKDIAGLDFTSDSENSLKGAYAKASQESISLLAGQTGAVRVIMEDIRGSMQPIREQMQFIYDLQKEGWQDVKAIRDLTVKIDKNSEKVAENTRQIKEVADKVADNTKRTADTLEGRIDVNIKGM